MERRFAYSVGEATTHPKEVREKFIELRAEGRTLVKVAKELKIAYNTAVDWNKEFLEEIDAAKAFQVEEMMEKYRMTRDKRIEMYGERLLALQDELAKRDLSEIPTGKLFEMMMKCSKELQTEIGTPKFLTESEIKSKKMKRSFHESSQDIYCI